MLEVHMMGRCNGLLIGLRMARHARPLLSPLTQPSHPGPRLFHACRPKLFNISSKVAARTPNHEQLEDPEAFYNFWLSFKLRPAQPVRTYCSHHLQNLHLATCLERLPPGLKEDPLAFFGSASKERDLDLARLCLNAYIAKRNQLLPDKETVREHYIRDRPGSKALLWLWNFQSPNLSTDVLLNAGFSRALTSCVVAEGYDEYIWEWMRLMTAPKRDLQAVVELRRLKASWLRLLGEAQAYWTLGSSTLLRPLDSFHRAFDPKNSMTRDTDEAYVQPSVYLLGAWLLRTIRSCSFGEISADAFDRLIDHLHFVRDAEQRELIRSSLLLRHPTTPDAKPMLQFWSAVDASSTRSDFVQALMNPRFADWAFSLLFTIVTAAQILQGQGDLEGAKWLLGFGYKTLRKEFDESRARSLGLPTETIHYDQRFWGSGWRPPTLQSYEMQRVGSSDNIRQVQAAHYTRVHGYIPT